MIQVGLNEIIRKHGLWLKNEDGGERADLEGANLQNTNLWYSNLKDANLQAADLRDAILKAAYLEGADLRSAKLNDADLQFADLKAAYLEGADLKAADLKGVNLRDANLQGADLDFSCWPLWCGSLGVIVDARIARQLMYHALSVLCDDPEFMEIRNDPKILAFVNKFHRVQNGDCKVLKPIEQKEQEEETCG